MSQLDQTTLERIADFLAETSDPWWVLGSAAMALIGVDPGEIRDIDLLVSAKDARALMRKHGLTNQADGGTDQYRSDFVLTPDLGDRPVEILSGYQICQGGIWAPAQPQSRQSIQTGSVTMFVPDRAEQIALLKRLGRPKDLIRLQMFDDAD